MQGLTSLFLLGTFAFQTILGSPGSSRVRREGVILKRAVDSFIATEEPIALQKLLNNIGSTGSSAQGASAGIVIASPSKSDPDYFFTWTRDAALVFKAIVERFTNSYDAGLQTQIQNYIISQAKLQTVSNPSGSLSDGKGLGEAKYHVDLSAFTDVTNSIWPIIRNDLTYVAQYWNQTGFDLWEEVNGSSFFTVAAQHRSLVEGSALAQTLGTSHDSYDAIAPHVLCFLQTFWSSSSGYALANINVNNGRSAKDGNVILASIHNFDAALGCDAATFQPCSDKALSSHKVVVDSFRSIYGLNSGIPSGSAVAVGRYPEDSYYNGNPWYLLTLAAAEQLYDALYVWQTTGSITVTSTSLPFFQDLVSGVSAGTYKSGTDTYTAIYNAVFLYADGFVNVVSKYTGSDGALAEQYNRDSGSPLSAKDLTWSYASFLTAAARRAGVVPPSWAGAGSTATSVPVSARRRLRVDHTPRHGFVFPANQTPVTTTVPTTTITRPTVTPTTTTGTCTVATAVAVTFNELKTTDLRPDCQGSGQRRCSRQLGHQQGGHSQRFSVHLQQSSLEGNYLSPPDRPSSTSTSWSTPTAPYHGKPIPTAPTPSPRPVPLRRRRQIPGGNL
ncbi:Glucoamylase [Daldinia childiae]|uniref:Glucoamylase n=1 Tax=Daldinia childiae TaxID=326645 RepID=UPI00144531E5|nr:Glucoamylase [Daldinia childiae]KAF3070979.1 Glucoamylase [Daldinia childiae]